MRELSREEKDEAIARFHERVRAAQCPICESPNCAGHIHMRDPRLNSPGSPQTPGFARDFRFTPRPYGMITAADARKAPLRKKQEEAIARKRAAERAELDGIPAWM